MKNFLKTAFILFAFFALLFSCADGTEEKGNNGNGQGSDYNMAGSYGFKVNGQDCVWVFKADGTYEISGYGITGTKTGGWSSKGNDLTLNYATNGGWATSGSEVFTVQASGNQVTLAVKDSQAQVSSMLVSLSITAKSVTLTKTSGGTDNGGTGFPAAKGKLTVTGLDNFNGKYVFANGLAGGNVLQGITDITGYPSDITYKLASVSNGKAEIPLYTPNNQATSYSNSYTAYSGNDAVTSLSVIILNENVLKASNAGSAINSNLGLKQFSTGTFSNGNMELAWAWEPPNGVIADQVVSGQWFEYSLTSTPVKKWFTFTATSSKMFVYAKFISNYNVGFATDPIYDVYDEKSVKQSLTQLKGPRISPFNQPNFFPDNKVEYSRPINTEVGKKYYVTFESTGAFTDNPAKYYVTVGTADLSPND